MPNACHLLVDQLVDLAYSGKPAEDILEQATLMLRRVIEAKPFDPVVATDGFRADLLAHSDPSLRPVPLPDGLGVKNPASFQAGREVGLALGAAIRGKIPRTHLRDKLRAILCD